VRSAITDCTGETGIANEDTADYCKGWIPKTRHNADSEKCTTDVYEYTYRCIHIIIILISIRNNQK
jgi:hypothetical protein